MKYNALLKITIVEENEIKESISFVNLKLFNLDKVISDKNILIQQCELISSNPKDILLTMSALNHIELLRKELRILNNQKQLIAEELNILENKLIEKKSERKGLEKLIENNKKLELAIKEKKEQSFLDELNSRD